MKKLRFTKDARELAKLTGKQSYVTTVSSSKLSPTHQPNTRDVRNMGRVKKDKIFNSMVLLPIVLGAPSATLVNGHTGCKSDRLFQLVNNANSCWANHTQPPEGQLSSFYIPVPSRVTLEETIEVTKEAHFQDIFYFVAFFFLQVFQDKSSPLKSNLLLPKGITQYN